MVRDCLACAIVVACTSTPFSNAGAEPRAVVELFTSQGCSSCPPADKLLAQFALDPSLVPISLPIDYWDYLGWRDTLADPRNSARQRAYSHVRGDREVYTPQVVVNGTVHTLGSDKEAIEAAIAASHKSVLTMALPVTMKISDGRILVSVPGGEAHSLAEVWICGLLKSATVAIGRGENRGKTITYHNVARHWVKLGTWNGKTETWSLPIQDFGDEGIDEAAVMVQGGTVEKPSAIYGAAVAAIH
jgi:hypothetical protein